MAVSLAVLSSIILNGLILGFVGGTAGTAFWGYLNKVYTITRVARNQATHDELNLVEQSLEDADFKFLVFQIQRVLNRCNCQVCKHNKYKICAARLNRAVTRVTIEKGHLPPIGPVLIDGDDPPGVSVIPMHLIDADGQRFYLTAPGYRESAQAMEIADYIMDEEERLIKDYELHFDPRDEAGGDGRPGSQQEPSGAGSSASFGSSSTAVSSPRSDKSSPVYYGSRFATTTGGQGARLAPPRSPTERARRAGAYSERPRSERGESPGGMRRPSRLNRVAGRAQDDADVGARGASPDPGSSARSEITSLLSGTNEAGADSAEATMEDHQRARRPDDLQVRAYMSSLQQLARRLPTDRPQQLDAELSLVQKDGLEKVHILEGLNHPLAELRDIAMANLIYNDRPRIRPEIENVDELLEITNAIEELKLKEAARHEPPKHPHVNSFSQSIKGACVCAVKSTKKACCCGPSRTVENGGDVRGSTSSESYREDLYPDRGSSAGANRPPAGVSQEQAYCDSLDRADERGGPVRPSQPGIPAWANRLPELPVSTHASVRAPTGPAMQAGPQPTIDDSRRQQRFARSGLGPRAVETEMVHQSGREMPDQRGRERRSGRREAGGNGRGHGEDRRAQGDDRGAQGGDRGAQGGDRGAQGGGRGAKGGERGAQGGERRAQGDDRGAQGGDRGAQGGDRGAQGGGRREQGEDRRAQGGESRAQGREGKPSRQKKIPDPPVSVGADWGSRDESIDLERDPRR